ncbi:PLP-dependent cysteine synthase family protein [Desertivirga arenae]|uniref:PLP-dependent cysteine synthase family protein n=1 Tax=Desertivirga arenae TaxID=2810309 RepID=UPI001A95F033|nr:PLP-dependent cysteine synthase family protein [Pedobacter sp. SYSU D00823]
MNYYSALEVDLKERFDNLWNLVGNTPMIEISYTYKGKPGKIYAKCEHYNLTGSVKDRMALYILYNAYKEKKIQPGDVIIEATSGNTGIAFAALGRTLGHDVKIIMPNWLSRERIDIIKSLGADVILVSKEEGGFLGSIALSEKMAAQGGVFLPCQFENGSNASAHRLTTGPEISTQLQNIGLSCDAFVAGVGTGGTVMGTGAYLKTVNPAVKVHPLEPAESPTLSTGFKVGTHRIQGISDEFIPAILKMDELDSVVQANDGDAIIMAQKLSQQLGLAVGISSGANVIGAIKLQEQMGVGSVVVTILSDSNKKYLSTDLVREEPVKEEYISTNTDFKNYRSIRRLENPAFLSELN